MLINNSLVKYFNVFSIPLLIYTTKFCCENVSYLNIVMNNQSVNKLHESKRPKKNDTIQWEFCESFLMAH